jgi:hypothetical protein
MSSVLSSVFLTLQPVKVWSCVKLRACSGVAGSVSRSYWRMFVLFSHGILSTCRCVLTSPSHTTQEFAVKVERTKARKNHWKSVNRTPCHVTFVAFGKAVQKSKRRGDYLHWSSHAYTHTTHTRHHAHIHTHHTSHTPHTHTPHTHHTHTHTYTTHTHHTHTFSHTTHTTHHTHHAPHTPHTHNTTHTHTHHTYTPHTHTHTHTHITHTTHHTHTYTHLYTHTYLHTAHTHTHTPHTLVTRDIVQVTSIQGHQKFKILQFESHSVGGWGINAQRVWSSHLIKNPWVTI